jgi:drug/metabolite transporter (DMT)-like permease
MNSWLSITITIITGLCIVTGQALMSVFSRRFPDLSDGNYGIALSYTFLSTAFYGFLAAYIIGAALYMILLRYAPLGQVTVTLLGTMLILTAVYTIWLGQSLSSVQWFGYVLVASGVILLQIRN